MKQSEKVYRYIQEFGSITSREAFLDLGIIQLPKRIFELKHSGIVITDKWIKVKNRYGEETFIKQYFIGSLENENCKEKQCI